MKNQMDPGKQFEKELKEELQMKQFRIPNYDNIKIDVQKAFSKTSIRSMGCSVETYGSIVSKIDDNNPDFDLYEVSFLLNCMHNQTPESM